MPVGAGDVAAARHRCPSLATRRVTAARRRDVKRRVQQVRSGVRCACRRRFAHKTPDVVRSTALRARSGGKWRQAPRARERRFDVGVRRIGEPLKPNGANWGEHRPSQEQSPRAANACARARNAGGRAAVKVKSSALCVEGSVHARRVHAREMARAGASLRQVAAVRESDIKPPQSRRKTTNSRWEGPRSPGGMGRRAVDSPSLHPSLASSLALPPACPPARPPLRVSVHPTRAYTRPPTVTSLSLVYTCLPMISG